MIKEGNNETGARQLLWGGRCVGSSKVVEALKALLALTLPLTQDPKTVVVGNSPTCEKEMCCRDCWLMLGGRCFKVKSVQTYRIIWKEPSVGWAGSCFWSSERPLW